MKQAAPQPIVPAAALLAIGGACVQAAPAEPTTFVVTGLRASPESAPNARRTENSIVDVIKAEDIGCKF